MTSFCLTASLGFMLEAGSYSTAKMLFSEVAEVCSPMTERIGHMRWLIQDMSFKISTLLSEINGFAFRRKECKAGPLDLKFWSFSTFWHHGIETVEGHLV